MSLVYILVSFNWVRDQDKVKGLHSCYSRRTIACVYKTVIICHTMLKSPLPKTVEMQLLTIY